MKRPIDYFGNKGAFTVISGHGIVYMLLFGLFGMRRFSVGEFRRSLTMGLMMGLGIGTGIVVGNNPYKTALKGLDENSS